MDVRHEVVEMATPLADELGFEVVDVDFVPQSGRSLVRVFLDRPGGITLDDCALFSRRLGDLLEMNQTLPRAYNLEVSSPGIERRLRTEEHFRRFVGRTALGGPPRRYFTTTVPRWPCDLTPLTCTKYSYLPGFSNRTRPPSLPPT